MKHVSMVDYYDGSSLEDKVDEWISENEANILEIIDIEYTQHGNVYLAIITYEARNE
jgi:hypothetical protein